MSIARKELRLIANAVRETNRRYGYYEELDFLVNHLCIVFQTLNPRFSRSKFEEACSIATKHKAEREEE